MDCLFCKIVEGEIPSCGDCPEGAYRIGKCDR